MNRINVAIIDAGGANLTSVSCTLERLGVRYTVTSDPKEISSADRVIFPGVGAAPYAMRCLLEKNLDVVIQNLIQPFLGICLGQQLLCESSAENDVDCLGIIPIPVVALQTDRIVPHMGWNTLKMTTVDEPFLYGLQSSDDFYFVHSYASRVDKRFTLATCEYGESFSAVIRHRNFYGVQFHPEKSGVIGERLLKNFLTLTL